MLSLHDVWWHKRVLVASTCAINNMMMMKRLGATSYEQQMCLLSLAQATVTSIALLRAVRIEVLMSSPSRSSADAKTLSVVPGKLLASSPHEISESLPD